MGFGTRTTGNAAIETAFQRASSWGSSGLVVEQKVHCKDCTGLFPHTFFIPIYLSLVSSLIKHTNCQHMSEPKDFPHLICPSLCSMEIRPPNGLPIGRENEAVRTRTRPESISNAAAMAASLGHISSLICDPPPPALHCCAGCERRLGRL